jgi:hypothetical protein
MDRRGFLRALVVLAAAGLAGFGGLLRLGSGAGLKEAMHYRRLEETRRRDI